VSAEIPDFVTHYHLPGTPPFLSLSTRPQRSAPHYFVLGESPWYRGLAAGMQAVTMALGDLPFEMTSFTYPDSFTAMATLAEFGVTYEPRPYHGRVYRLDELADVVDRYGLPVDTTPTVYKAYETRPFEKYIEVQLWSDDPVAGLLSAGIADRV